MIEFIATIECENDAFYAPEPLDDWAPAPELARLLRVAADRVEREAVASTRFEMPLIDSNGNRTGTVRFFDPHQEHP